MPTSDPIPRSDGPNILHVGPTEAFPSLTAAMLASKDGDTIQIAAGIYLDDAVTITHSVTIEGVGGMAQLAATHEISNGKAILIDDAASLTIRNIGFSGARVADGNGAGIRYERGNLVIENSQFFGNQEGILGAPVADGHVTISGSIFVDNGAGDGQTHGAYFGVMASLAVVGSIFSDQRGGSDLKSRAGSNLIEANLFYDSPQGLTNYQIDLPNGGNSLVVGNIFGKSAEAGNRAFIHFGGEIADAGGALLVAYNLFTSDRDPSVAVLNQTHQPVTVTNDAFSANVSIPIDGAGDAGADLPLIGLAALPLLLLL